MYLDSQKLRSISSQIFKGVPEQVLLVNEERTETSDSQKGEFASGRLIADIFAKEKSSSELRFLEDHAYSLFEEHVLNEKLAKIYGGSFDAEDASKSFVLVTGRLRINDFASTTKLLENFNEIGEAFWRVTNMPGGILGPNLKNLSDSEVKKRAGEAGMQFEKKFMDNATKLLRFGYNGLIEANINFEDKSFSAPLKREFLRDSEEMILHKYSRYTQREFSMLGVVTQSGSENNESAIPDVKDADGIKEAMRALTLHLRTLEQVFAAPSANETMLDPIAIYTTL
ncbi:DUF6414 family protein [Sphingomonas radiodurans]|uniref:DUF6414 family protein n=1 Tax=Sphingomonas radiodurans TaxID=2890321 RepID=UPI001E4020DE|nr:hypothetical protein [Sphingomonas radiodurans]WBH17456.1 hypothetical protein LLW23_04940 [Sphingomonas radiodurans]